MRNSVLMGFSAVTLLACGWLFGSGAFAQDSAETAAAPCVAPQWSIQGGEDMGAWLLNTKTGKTWRISKFETQWAYVPW